MSLLVVDSLVAGYGPVDILQGVNLAVAAGQIAVIVGPNGAGKSTAMKAIFGLAQIRGGRVLFQDEEVTRLPADKLVARGIAASRLSAQGVGSSAPVASNDSESGRAQNRRVELVKQ